MKKKTFALTGATGLLGRNLLFEIIKQNLNNLDNIKIFLLGRSNSDKSISSRVAKILKEDGVDYICADIEIIEYVIKNIIVSINVDLDKDGLDISAEDLAKLKYQDIDFFYHIASQTDFRSTPVITRILENTNVEGTRRILKLIDSLDLKEFSYVSSAYVCGYYENKKSRIIEPDYINENENFRNSYEKTKLSAEILVRNYEKKTGLKCRYFRPSTICGRLIEKPFGSISKFDVFYAWGMWFLKQKMKSIENYDNIFDKNVDIPIRMCIKQGSGLNMVPADYSAKLMYYVSMSDSIENSFYLVNTSETNHEFYTNRMLELLNISGLSFTDEVPSDLTKLEKIYYKTVGGIFHGYINSEPMIFNDANIKSLCEKYSLSSPEINQKNFDYLIEYAKKKNFGLI